MTVQGPVIQGSTNIPLNENGRQQARDSAKRAEGLDVTISKIYSSPLDRAKETADTIAGKLGLHVTLEPAMSAGSWGECEGKTGRYRTEQYGFDGFGSIRTDGWQEMETKERWKKQPIPNADSRRDVQKRMKIAFKRIASESKPGDTILVASHQENIKAFSLYCQFAKIEELRSNKSFEEITKIEAAPIKNCEFYRFQYDSENKKFSYFGEVK